MNDPRFRPVWLALAVLLGVWGLAWGGYHLSGASKVTADKIQAHVEKNDLAGMQGQDRAEAIEDLIAMINRLPAEERRRLRRGGSWDGWFEAMTEPEKEQFLAGTLPSGFQQMLDSFEALEPEKRQKAVRDAVRRLQKARTEDAAFGGGGGRGGDGNGGRDRPVLSENLQDQVMKIGLATYFRESSAQTKAELAPFLEEVQRSMENGRLFRDR